jgi:hypothetical protein
MAILSDELLRYPLVDHDDCVDALALTDMVTKRPTALQAINKVPRGSFEDIRLHMAKKHKKSGLGAESIIGAF